jgi:hypothetical protein
MIIPVRSLKSNFLHITKATQPSKSYNSTSMIGDQMSQLLTENELNEIDARANLATQGPWKSYVEGRDHQSGSNFIMTGQKGSRGEDIELTGATTADQDFIASARADIPKLVAEIRRLRGVCSASM